jgi:hypothetical protein
MNETGVRLVHIAKDSHVSHQIADLVATAIAREAELQKQKIRA